MLLEDWNDRACSSDCCELDAEAATFDVSYCDVVDLMCVCVCVFVVVAVRCACMEEDNKKATGEKLTLSMRVLFFKNALC